MPFGNFEYQEIFSKRYKVFVSELAYLDELVNTAFGSVNSLRNEPLDYICYFLLHEIVEDFHSLVILCSNGYSRTASKILRSMFEHTVTMKYLTEHPDQTELFKNFYLVNRRKEFNRLKKLFPDIASNTNIKNVIDTAEADYQKYIKSSDNYKISSKNVCDVCKEKVCEKCKKETINHSWSKLSIIDMAEKIGGLSYTILTAYIKALTESHPSFNSIEKRVKLTDKGVEYNYLPNEEDEEEVLFSSHHLLLLGIDTFGNYFQVKKIVEEPLDKSFVRVWKNR